MSNTDIPAPPKVIDVAKMKEGIEYIIKGAECFKEIDTEIYKTLLGTAEDLLAVGDSINEFGLRDEWATKRTNEGEATVKYEQDIIDITNELLED